MRFGMVFLGDGYEERGEWACLERSESTIEERGE